MIFQAWKQTTLKVDATFQQGNWTNIEHKLLLNSLFVKNLMKHKFGGIL